MFGLMVNPQYAAGRSARSAWTKRTSSHASPRGFMPDRAIGTGISSTPRRGPRRGGEPCVELAMLGHNQAQPAGSEVDRYLLERAHRVHSEKKRGSVVELQLLEDMRIGENDGEILEPDRSHRDLANGHVVA